MAPAGSRLLATRSCIALCQLRICFGKNPSRKRHDHVRRLLPRSAGYGRSPVSHRRRPPHHRCRWRRCGTGSLHAPPAAQSGERYRTRGDWALQGLTGLSCVHLDRGWFCPGVRDPFAACGRHVRFHSLLFTIHFAPASVSCRPSKTVETPVGRENFPCIVRPTSACGKDL